MISTGGRQVLEILLHLNWDNFEKDLISRIAMKKRAAFPSGQCTVRSTGRHLLKALQSFVENNTINSDQHSSHLPRSSKMCKNLNVSCGENINRHHTTAVHYSWAIATINLHVSTTHLNKLELKKKLFKNHFYLANAMPLVRCGNDESGQRTKT